MFYSYNGHYFPPIDLFFNGAKIVGSGYRCVVKLVISRSIGINATKCRGKYLFKIMVNKVLVVSITNYCCKCHVITH